MKTINIFLLLIMAISMTAAAAQGSEKQGADTFKELKAELYRSIREGDEEGASLYRQLINEYKQGRDVTLPTKDDKSEEELDKDRSELKLFKEPSVKEAQRMIENKRKGEQAKEEFKKDQEDEYVARGLLLDGKKLIVRQKYLHAREIIAKAHEIKPDDEDIGYHFRLLQFPSAAVSMEKNQVSFQLEPKVEIKIHYEEKAEGIKDWAQSWELQIINTDSSDIVRTITGEGLPPGGLNWFGKNAEGGICEDGAYELKLRLSGRYFCVHESKAFKFSIESELPNVQIAVRNQDKRFITGKEDVIVRLHCTNPKIVSSWAITAVDQSGKVVARFTGKAMTESIKWDGRDMDGRYVGEGDIITFRISGRDSLGKSWQGNEDQVESDIKIENNMISLQNITFETGKADLKKDAMLVLDKVAELLKSRSWFDVKIEGHTDHIGNDDYNRKLSEKRAYSVLRYLVKKGVDKKMLTSAGTGESRPKQVTESDSQRYRFLNPGDVLTEDFINGKDRKLQDLMKALNRRVEFHFTSNEKRFGAEIERRRKESREKAASK